MIWKALLALGLVAFLTGTVVWFVHGQQVYTKDREKVITLVEDELFGTTHEEVELKSSFKLGLLPDSLNPIHSYRSFAFIGGLSLTVVLFSMYKIRRSKKTS